MANALMSKYLKYNYIQQFIKLHHKMILIAEILEQNNLLDIYQEIKKFVIFRRTITDDLVEINYIYKKNGLKIKNGPVRVWHGNGIIYLETYYKNNKEEGLKRKWTQHGYLSYIAHYKNNKKHGICVSYYFPSGQIHYIENYSHGRLHGPHKLYVCGDEYGPLTHRLNTEKNYFYGKLHGKRREWFWSCKKTSTDNGQIKSEENYSYGFLNGEQKSWSYSGELIVKNYYINGIKVN